ncbi:MAG: PIN domain-containing protein [Acidobacteria bacterium]|nr:MAG: PIN domain-containing protein [Acidobacteriota bacterium]
MTRINAFVTDTHPLLFHASGGARLGKRARAIFDAAEDGRAIIYVPSVVIWEVGLLARAVRVNLHRPVRAFFADLFSNSAFQPHPLDAAQAFDAEELRFTRDTFDALVTAAARDLELPLITRDEAIGDSGAVKTIW